MMIELRFEQMKPRTLAAFETEFEKALPERAALSPLGAFWRTEVGNIDQVVQAWAYESVQQREQVLQRAANLPAWRAIDCNAASIEQEVRLVKPAPFSPPIAARQLGNIYEMRIYDYEAGAIPAVIERWQEKIGARVRISPLVMCGYTETGRMHQWVHVWAYDNAAERQRVRAEAIKQKIWPPDARAGLLRQRNMLLVPSSFSPLRWAAALKRCRMS